MGKDSVAAAPTSPSDAANLLFPQHETGTRQLLTRDHSVFHRLSAPRDEGWYHAR